MASLRLILGDQLTPDIAALDGADADRDTVLMAEVMSEATYVRHHKQKLVLVFSAMRHFAEELREAGWQVRYVRLDDPGNEGSLKAQTARTLDEIDGIERVIVTRPGEWRLLSDMEEWEGHFGCPVELREDTRFIASIRDFADWAEGRKSLRMEYFYRDMRRRTGLLMEGDKPAGGAWNFDQDNRRSLPASKDTPHRRDFRPDKITREVIDMVETRFPDHFGTLRAFRWGVTRSEAEAARDHFINDILPNFGDFQDAMARQEAFLWHSLLSAYLNLGLLDPLDVCRRAETAWKRGHAPLNAVEGFIRQILGWREYVRGLYWWRMPGYRETNHFGADRALPDFYWTGETDMACLREAVLHSRDHAYSHHIQRLMVTGNFALLAGIHPGEVNEWYMIVYADAYEWVELPNTHGMAIFADGGLMASKPYAASANYINKMSDFCSSCVYSPTRRTGERACPFNYLYWTFLDTHRERLKENGRMGLVMKNLEKKDEGELAEMRRLSDDFLAGIGAVPRG
ncbi:MAG: cryptochrome/photolyase family protein [Alphaproteobacteria bacterium]|nr:cryptochrome/photolyase family protein [Alphaproteobacteria bacterium]